MQKLYLIIITLILLPLPVLAQSVDGVIDNDEYSVAVKSDGMMLHVESAADSLFLAVSAPTEGWIAVGIGSMRMDGSSIFIGYVDGNRTEFRIDYGRGHSHRKSDDVRVISYALTEKDGITSLEIELDKSTVQITNPLETTVAYGKGDNFRDYHSYRAALKVNL